MSKWLDRILGNDNNKSPQSVVDLDGNVYGTIKIGRQVWMLQNLKVTKYQNGDDIPIVTKNEKWSSLDIGAYCWYDNKIKNKDIYGALYNQIAIDDSRKLTPLGWHVPIREDWEKLIDYLGGREVAGGKLKEIGANHWESPNKKASNSSGFTALPGGRRGQDGVFCFMGQWGFWWSSHYFINGHYLLLQKESEEAPIWGNAKKVSGYSIRCIKD